MITPTGSQGSRIPHFKRQSVAYYFLMAVGGFFGLAKGLIYAKALGSEEMGVYSFGALLALYGISLATFGVYRGLDCVLPVLFGGREIEKAYALRNLSAGYLLLVTGLMTGCTFLISLLPVFTNPAIAPLLRAAVVLAVTTAHFGLALIELRSNGRTLELSAVIAIKGALLCAIGLLATGRISATGLIAAESAINSVLFVVSAAWLSRRYSFSFRPPGAILELMRVGVPVSIKDLIQDFTLYLDRWSIVYLFGFDALGKYAFALALVAVGEVIRTAIGMRIGATAAQEFGRSGSIRAMLARINQSSRVALALFLLGWIPFSFLSGHMVRRYFPDYSEVVTILPILYLGVALQTINIYEWIPMALKRTRLLLASTLIALAGVAAIYGVGVLRGWPISGFAWGFVASRALMLTAHFVISVVLTNRYEGERRKSSLESIDDSTHLIR